ncbi:glycosyltransferase [Cellulomonas sp. NTE-D12]|uniref:glycosyltransferase n=1 Tax=Cellulomonas sp. NTE-D12 TaxID=2962632 RepID=UPI0030815010|nr:hypothetical protein CELD12_23310 [Cellulomonas sp. NTE-D12]
MPNRLEPTVESLARVKPLGCDFELEAPARHRDLYEVRGYQPMSTALFRTVCAGADVVLDLGAHVGYFTLVAASAAPSATVVAVEASPADLEVLSRNVDGADAGTVRVVAGALQGVTEADLGLTGGTRLVVRLDVAGDAVAVLTGLEGLLSRFEDARLLVTVDPAALTAAGSGAEQLVERLRALGLRLFVLDEDVRSWRELADGRAWSDLVEGPQQANLYCVAAARCTTVAAVMHSSSVGGAERSHAEMVESLVRQGSMVHTVAPEPDLGLRALLEPLGGSVSAVPPLEWWTVWPDDEARTPDAWTARDLLHPRLLDVLAEIDPDVVLTQSGVVPEGAVAAAALRRPHVWYLREFGDLDHGLVLPGGPEGYGAAVRALATRVVTNSDAVRRHLFGEAAADVTVLHPVPRVQGVVGPAEARGAVDDVRRPWSLGIVGSLNPGKGQQDAVDAVAVLRGEGTDVHLVLAGPAAPGDWERLRDLAVSRGVEDLVEHADTFTDRSQMYAGFDAVAITSRSEAFGRVPFEATEFGLPLIYAEAGGPAEYLRPGETGLAYPVGDAEALAAAIRRLHDEPQLGAELAAAARVDLTDPRRRAEYDEALRQLIDEAAARPAPGVLLDVLGDVARSGARHAAQAAEVRADLTRVVSEHEELVGRFRELEQAHAELVEGHRGYVAAHERAAAEHEALVAERDACRAELLESRAANAALRTKVGDASERAAALELELRGSRDREADALRELSAIVGSRTWRTRTWLARGLRRG